MKEFWIIPTILGFDINLLNMALVLAFLWNFLKGKRAADTQDISGTLFNCTYAILCLVCLSWTAVHLGKESCPCESKSLLNVNEGPALSIIPYRDEYLGRVTKMIGDSQLREKDYGQTP